MYAKDLEPEWLTTSEECPACHNAHLVLERRPHYEPLSSENLAVGPGLPHQPQRDFIGPAGYPTGDKIVIGPGRRVGTDDKLICPNTECDYERENR